MGARSLHAAHRPQHLHIASLPIRADLRTHKTRPSASDITPHGDPFLLRISKSLVLISMEYHYVVNQDYPVPKYLPI
jgi:hypothetical protein